MKARPARDRAPSCRPPVKLETTTRVTMAMVARAVARCAVTISGGSSWRTVMPPRMTWKTSSTDAAVAGQRMDRCCRYRSHATTRVASTSSPTTEAASRCVYSMRTSRSKGGMTCPWHMGQSGQPKPDPVTRTTPPMTMSTYMAAAVARERRRMVVMVRSGTGRRPRAGGEGARGRGHAAPGRMAPCSFYHERRGRSRNAAPRRVQRRSPAPRPRPTAPPAAARGAPPARGTPPAGG